MSNFINIWRRNVQDQKLTQMNSEERKTMALKNIALYFKKQETMKVKESIDRFAKTSQFVKRRH